MKESVTRRSAPGSAPGSAIARFFARRKFRKEILARLNAMLKLYPGGVKNIPRDHPWVRKIINDNFNSGDMRPGELTVHVAGFIVAGAFEHLQALRPELLNEVCQQLREIDLFEFNKVCRQGGRLPKGMKLAAAFAAFALLEARDALEQGEISELSYETFLSEVVGALQGKKFHQRSNDRMVDAIRTAFQIK